MKQLPLLICLALVGITYFMGSTPPARLPNGAVPVKVTNGFDWFRSTPEVDGLVTVSDPAGAPLGSYYLWNGLLYQDPAAKQKSTLEISRTRYALDPGLDIGAWCGLSAGPTDSSHPERFQAGLRASPIRLLYGTVALDAVASHDLGGAGATFYPPAEYFGRGWRHVGLGGWYCVPWSGGSPGWVFGLGFSTRD